jgi:lysophospholipase L1-like esterase
MLKISDRQNVRRRHPTTILGALVLLFASVLVGLLVFEMILRIWGYRPPLQSEWVLKSHERVPNRDVLLLPPKFLQASFYETDSSRPTIIVMGDSFTEGYPVKPQDSYPAILENVLNQRGVAAQIVNAGIGDSGPDQHFSFLQQYLLPRLRPSIVIWTLYPNDITDNYIRPVYKIDHGKLAPLEGAFKWLYIRQLVHQWTPLPDWVKQHSFGYRIVMKALEALGEYSIPNEYAKNPIAWGAEKLRLEIQGFKELAVERNFVGYFVLVAPESVYLAKPEPERWSRYWLSQGYETMLAMLKHEPNFIHAWFPKADPAQIYAGSDRDATEYGRHHFNEAGYALLAQVVAQRILREERLELRPSKVSK